MTLARGSHVPRNGDAFGLRLSFWRFGSIPTLSDTLATFAVPGAREAFIIWPKMIGGLCEDHRARRVSSN